MKWAIQMYTLRDSIHDTESLLQALRKVKELGYDGVEFAGYFDTPPEQLAAAAAELGLTIVSSHEPIDRLEQDLDGILDYAVRLGNKTVIMAWSPANSPEELERTLRVLRTARDKAAPLGIRVLYHNHDHEFRKVGELLPIDEIVKITPLEVDSYWVFFAGRDPAQYLLDNASNIGLLHLKDGGSAKASPCAIGEGENDISGILASANKLGTEWVIVEDDFPTPNGFDDIARSMNWLRSHT